MSPSSATSSAADRIDCMEAVARIEQALRATLAPTKVNLASFGNMVAHLHWHVIARFDWDSHFPQPVWGAAQRIVEPPAEVRLALSLDALDDAVRACSCRAAGRGLTAGRALWPRSWPQPGSRSSLPLRQRLRAMRAGALKPGRLQRSEGDKFSSPSLFSHRRCHGHLQQEGFRKGR